MKLIVACGLLAAVAFSSAGLTLTKDQAQERTCSASRAPVWNSSTGPVDLHSTDVSLDELRALRDGGAAGITTHSVKVTKPKDYSAVANAIECGSSEGGVANFSDIQCGPTIESAMGAAMFGVELQIALAHPNDCQDCPIPDGCGPSISTLDADWSFGLPWKVGAQWCIKATYNGAYLYVCDPCFK